MKFKRIIEIRYWLCRYLIFLSIAGACRARNGDLEKPAIVWSGGKAISVSFHTDASAGNARSAFSIHLPQSTTEVLGDLTAEEGNMKFTPLVPFTRGLTYVIKADGDSIGSFTIPSAGINETPSVIALYPDIDTVPENLLKWTLVFSQPMQEGEALKHIHLIKNHADTLKEVFLDLQPELWNNDRTVLTLWMDPGRIKRGLQPNLRLGPPLQPFQNYQLLIDSSWRGISGAELSGEFKRSFTTGIRDSISPDPQKWKLQLPVPGKVDTLKINFDESLDHVLAEITFQVSGPSGKIIEGEYEVDNKGKRLCFIPSEKWIPGKYRLSSESRLEDLAGNNLNRLFDSEVHKETESAAKEYYYLEFVVK